jgi:hypothetical protein
LEVAGEPVGNWSEGKRFFINQMHWEENFVYLPPLEVSVDFNFISGLAGILPSPDWFSGFYMFDVINEYSGTYYDSFLIRTYPWDAGTDSGERFTDIKHDTDPPETVVRLTPKNTPNKASLSADGTQIKFVAEWECVLHACPEEQSDCQKPDWPPENDDGNTDNDNGDGADNDNGDDNNGDSGNTTDGDETPQQPMETECYPAGNRFRCAFGTHVEGEREPATISMEVECDLDSKIGFDFRRASGCFCQATVTPGNAERSPKTCPCSICPSDWGSIPLHIDCSVSQEENLEFDPYIVDSCVSIDCAGNCNGTCRIDCPASDGGCQFCPSDGPDDTEDGSSNNGDDGSGARPSLPSDAPPSMPNGENPLSGGDDGLHDSGGSEQTNDGPNHDDGSGQTGPRPLFGVHGGDGTSSNPSPTSQELQGPRPIFETILNRVPTSGDDRAGANNEDTAPTSSEGCTTGPRPVFEAGSNNGCVQPRVRVVEKPNREQQTQSLASSSTRSVSAFITCGFLLLPIVAVLG